MFDRATSHGLLGVLACACCLSHIYSIGPSVSESGKIKVLILKCVVSVSHTPSQPGKNTVTSPPYSWCFTLLACLLVNCCVAAGGYCIFSSKHPVCLLSDGTTTARQPSTSAQFYRNSPLLVANCAVCVLAAFFHWPRGWALSQFANALVVLWRFVL